MMTSHSRSPRNDPVPRAAVLRPDGRGRGGDDSGITLIEVLVAMTIMSVLMGMFTTGVLQVFRSANRSEALSAAQSQIHMAFQRLDTEIRYAAGISEQGQVGHDWYVEYLSTFTGTPVCTQLRSTETGLLQRRRWDEGATPPPFVQLASGVSGTHPFTRHPVLPGPGVKFQRLAVSLSATGGPDGRQREIDIVFTALNTSPATSSDTTCTEGRPAS